MNERAQARKKAEQEYRDAEPEGPDPFANDPVPEACLPAIAAHQQKVGEAKKAEGNAQKERVKAPQDPPEAQKTQHDQGVNGKQERKPPAWLYPKKVSALDPYLPPQVMKGLLYQGCRFVFGGSPKAKKSWLLMQSCFCVANGLPFLGIVTEKGKTVYLNFELLEGEARARFYAIKEALGAGDVDEVEVIQLKDKRLGPSELANLQTIITVNAFVMGAFDPVYKLMDGCDERIGKEVAPILAALANICEASKASVGYAQHFAKGNQKVKFAMDRISGTNYFVRDADVILVVTELAEIDCFRVDIIQRSFPDIRPFGIRWKHPIFDRDDSIDITNIREPGGEEKKADPITERMSAALYAANFEGGLTNTEWWHASQVKGLNGKPTPSEATFNRKRKAMMDRKEVEQSVITKKYLLTAEYAQKRADFYGKNEDNSHADES